MKKILILIIFAFTLVFALPDASFAQDQQQEEQMGKKLLDDLSNKIVTCSQLKDADFEKIGEYFMGQSIGDTSRHIAMNDMMKGMMGEQGEEQMHTAMGKRMSNCEPNASIPQTMMNMMMGGTNSIGWFGFNWIFMILLWGLVILAIVGLIKWIMSQSKGDAQAKSALDILRKRYAKGEINKKEFEEMKKVIS